MEGLLLKRIENLYKKTEFLIYISCILLIFAICILIYADGVIRDEYNVSIDGIRLMQNLLILVLFLGFFLALRSVLKSKSAMIIILIAFLAVSFYSLIMISTNILSIKKIIENDKNRKTEITQTYPVSTDDIEGVIGDVKLTWSVDREKLYSEEEPELVPLSKRYGMTPRYEQADV